MEGMRTAAPQLLEPLLSGAQAAALPELVSYLQDSFGNSTRIDYGTGVRECVGQPTGQTPDTRCAFSGFWLPSSVYNVTTHHSTAPWSEHQIALYDSGHETTFAGLLFCLARLGVLEPGDAAGLVLAVFPAYLALMRRLQTTYWLEPAGSHGVWGLDDYQILPFLWGSAQVR